MLLGAPLFYGCSGFRGPDMKVSGVVVSHATDEGLELEIYLDLANNNDTGTELRLYEYSVWVDGTRAYQGVWAAEQTIPAAAERSAMVPAVLLDKQLGWSKEARPEQVRMKIMGNVLYIAPGQLAETLLEWGLYQPRQAFGAEDSIELIIEKKIPEKAKSSSTAP
ncbi:MAG: hypothetical protein P8J86_01095 [Phycisphaerales bacterium]|nr:hypothetical protein [Phycisphaerales bacterium]